jgi:hypothetical protein
MGCRHERIGQAWTHQSSGRRRKQNRRAQLIQTKKELIEFLFFTQTLMSHKNSVI